MSSAPVYCSECERVNGSAATLCLWCGAPIVNAPIPPVFEATQAELDYVGGIERLDDPTPVRLSISEAGIEIVEIMPGSRRILIPASDVIDARVTGGGPAPGKANASPWWVRIGQSFSRKSRRTQMSGEESSDYTLTIRYQEGGEERSAVFHRKGGAGLSMIRGVTRSVASLVRLRVE
jgi:hypothetical protein